MIYSPHDDNGIHNRTLFRVADLTCYANADVAEMLQKVYKSHMWIYDYFAGKPESRSLRGRKPVMLGFLDGRSLVVKRLFHGGVLAGLTRDRFFSCRRITNAMEVEDFLTANGIETPHIEFGSWRRVHGFIRGEIGLRCLPEGMDASEFFFGRKPQLPRSWCERAGQIGCLVARLHAMSFFHPDLNLMNFYFMENGPTVILDLDKSMVPGRGFHRGHRHINLERLYRSIRKQGRLFSRDTVETIIRCVEESYRGACEQNTRR